MSSQFPGFDPSPRPFQKTPTVPICLAALALSLFSGCAKQPSLKPVNEVNRPIFHTTHQTSIGVEALRGLRETGTEGTLEGDNYLIPTLEAFVNVSDWAGYHLLPVYWSVLLTGNQYSDSTRLLQGRMHAALSGGLTGFAYSSRDGWQFQYRGSLEGKYLWTRRLFSQFSLNAERNSSREDAAYRTWLENKLGFQANLNNSLTLGYRLTRHHLSSDRIARSYHIDFGDNEDHSQFSLRHAYYWRSKHVFGPALGLGYRNYGDHPYLLAGLHYRFVFD